MISNKIKQARTANRFLNGDPISPHQDCHQPSSALFLAPRQDTFAPQPSANAGTQTAPGETKQTRLLDVRCPCSKRGSVSNGITATYCNCICFPSKAFSSKSVSAQPLDHVGSFQPCDMTSTEKSTNTMWGRSNCPTSILHGFAISPQKTKDNQRPKICGHLLLTSPSLIVKNLMFHVSI